MGKRSWQQRARGIAMIVLLLAATGAASGSPTVAAAGNPVYHDDFEDGNANGWTVSKGDWVVTSDGDTQVFKQTGNTTSTEGFVTAGEADGSDYTVSAKVKAISSLGTAAASGVMLRLQNDNNFYLFRINWGTQQAQLLKRTNGSYQYVKSVPLSSPGVVDGQWYELKAEAYGNVIEGYVDGVKLLSYTDTDAPFLQGASGFRTYAQVVEFDDFNIQPEKTIRTLFDDFEDGNADGWTVAKGSWVVTNDDNGKVYKQTGASANVEGFVTVGDADWTDYTIETKVKAVSRGGAGDASGIMIRVNNNNNFYLFRLHWDLDSAQLLKRSNGAYSVLTTGSLPFPDVAYGTWYALKVTVHHNVIEGYVNGVKVLSWTDTSEPIMNGAAGFRSYAQTVEFDDYEVALWNKASLNTDDLTLGTRVLIADGNQTLASVLVHTADPALFEGQAVQITARAGSAALAVEPASFTLYPWSFQPWQAGYAAVIPVALDTSSLQDSTLPVSITASLNGQTAYSLTPLHVAAPDAPDAPDAPTGLKASFLSAAHTIFDWDDADRAEQYKFYQSTQSEGPYMLASTVTASTYTVSGLAQDTTYYYKVSASNEGGESPLSSAVAITTLADPDAAPIPGANALAFEDDFDGNELDTNAWNYRIDNPVTGAGSLHSSQQAANVHVADGNAVIEARKENVGGKQYTGGGIITKQGLGYGYYETRAKYAVYAGWHPSFWTSFWDGSYPASTITVNRIEIDINEFELKSSSTTYENNLYEWQTIWDEENQKWKSVIIKRQKNAVPLPSDLQQEYHVWGVDYTADHVNFYLDGQLTSSYDSADYPFNLQHVWLSVISTKNAVVDDSKLPGALYVDYFKYYGQAAE